MSKHVVVVLTPMIELMIYLIIRLILIWLVV